MDVDDHNSNPAEVPVAITSRQATSRQSAERKGFGADFSRVGIPEISSLVVAAGQHAWVVLLLSLTLGGGTAWLAWKALAPSYLATSLVHVRERADYVLANRQSRNEDAAFVRVQESKVVLPQVLRNAFDHDSVQEIADKLPRLNQSEWLASIITADIKGGSEIMTISVAHEDPHIAWTLANAVTGAYIQEVTTEEAEDRHRRQAELERLADLANQRLASRWNQLQTLAKDLGTGSPHTLSLRDQIEMQGYREYAQRLRGVQMERNRLRLQLTETRMRQQSGYLYSDKELQYAVENHPEVTLHRQRIEESDARLREMAEVLEGANSPRLIQLRQDVEYYEKRMQQTIEAIRPKIREEMQRRLIAEREQEKESLEQRLAISQQEEAFLLGMLEQLEGNFEREEGHNGVQLEIIRHEIEREEGIVDNLWRSLEQLKIEQQARPRVSLLEAAKLPTTANRSRQIRAAVAAAGASVFAVVFAIGYAEWQTCRVRHPRDLLENTTIRLFGIGSFTVGLPWLWRMRYAKSDPITSGVIEITAHIRSRKATGKAASVFVSSATNTEPRYLVAQQLAVSLCRSGNRVLLVDTAGTTSRLVTGLAAEPQNAMESTDRATTDATSWVHSTTAKNLDFARIAPSHSEDGFVTADRLSRLIEKLGRNYGAVVVHGPPILTSPESVLIASKLDTTLLTVVVGKSRWNLVAAAQHRCESVGIHLLGAVMHVMQRTSPLDAASADKAERAAQQVTESSDIEQETAIVRELKGLQQDVANQGILPNQEGGSAKTKIQQHR